MVNHGTQKKRRSGRKVTRKPQKSWGVRQKNAVTDATMKGVWDSKHSVVENYAKAGLTSKVNKFSEIRALNSKERAFEGYMAVGPDINVRGANFLGKMSKFDQEYAVQLIDAHGEDYTAMERDTKTNTRQCSANQARKICEKYLTLKEDNVLVAAPKHAPMQVKKRGKKVGKK